MSPQPNGSAPAWVYATDALVRARVRIEAAEYHLRRVLETGERLDSRRTAVDQLADQAGVIGALSKVDRAKAALAELAEWKERGDG